MSKPIVKVTTFQIGEIVHTYIRREDNTKQEEKHYQRPRGTTILSRLASCIHLGTLKGNTHVVPFLGSSLGWTATPTFE